MVSKVSSRVSRRVLLAAIVLTGLALRIYFFMGLSYGGIWYVENAQRLLTGQFHISPSNLALRSGMLLPIEASIALFGSSEISVTGFSYSVLWAPSSLPICWARDFSAPRWDSWGLPL